jgi:hypothetical protein
MHVKNAMLHVVRLYVVIDRVLYTMKVHAKYKLETTLNCMVDFEPRTTGFTIPTYDCTRQHSKLRGHELSDSLTVLRDIVQ